MGVALGPDDVAFRMNLVTLRPHGGRVYMEDFSAGHIGSEQSHQLIASLQAELGDERFEFSSRCWLSAPAGLARGQRCHVRYAAPRHYRQADQ